MLTACCVFAFAYPPSPTPYDPAVQFLYTLVIEDQNKADKLTQSLPPGLPQKHI
jgi:hypothetical protein